MMHHQSKMKPQKLLTQIDLKILYAASVYKISPNLCRIWKKFLLQCCRPWCNLRSMENLQKKLQKKKSCEKKKLENCSGVDFGPAVPLRTVFFSFFLFLEKEIKSCTVVRKKIMGIFLWELLIGLADRLIDYFPDQLID